jgi:hypothetical protein
MDELRLRFDAIKSRSDIDRLISDSSISDGEYSWFELKGTAGKASIGKDEKKLFSKEICAFANTYGGILCIHKGSDSQIQEFDGSETASIILSLETWLRDSLEPPLQGMVIENREGLFIILIPMSKTKPHRSVSEKQYYYRHNTMSERMSELTISAMYRSQDYLATSASCILTKQNEQLHIDLIINNDSTIAGTKPRFEVEVLSSHQGFYEFSGNHIAPLRVGLSFRSSFQPIPNLNLHKNATIVTNDLFRECLLYPKDQISVFGISNPFPPGNPRGTLEFVKLFIIRFSYVFLEIPRQVKYFLIETIPSNSEGQQSCKVLMTCSENEKSDIALMYLAASSSNLTK